MTSELPWQLIKNSKRVFLYATSRTAPQIAIGMNDKLHGNNSDVNYVFIYLLTCFLPIYMKYLPLEILHQSIHILSILTTLSSETETLNRIHCTHKKITTRTMESFKEDPGEKHLLYSIFKLCARFNKSMRQTSKDTTKYKDVLKSTCSREHVSIQRVLLTLVPNFKLWIKHLQFIIPNVSYLLSYFYVHFIIPNVPNLLIY